MDNLPTFPLHFFGTVYDALLDSSVVNSFIGQEAVTVLHQRNVAPLSTLCVLIRIAHGRVFPSPETYNLEMKSDIPVTVRTAALPNLATTIVLRKNSLHANTMAVDIPRSASVPPIHRCLFSDGPSDRQGPGGRVTAG